ncbi:hypothetical protein PRUPE_8G072100 [Prunus persica]|uniref:Knottin scorpion toxin-like domain-containing protein n=1 Tax=Prunus persica TaxID=3760 RepID=A0A251MUH0_PRUPE|nr:hypothetical protein PRUPE_8G072100 [Prunus persica]
MTVDSTTIEKPNTQRVASWIGNSIIQPLSILNSSEMTRSIGSSTTCVLLIALLLVASMEMPVVEGGRGCKQASKSMTTCTAHPECDKKCKGEKAKMGLCRGPKAKSAGATCVNMNGNFV